MNEMTMKEFISGIQKNQWDFDFDQFCEVTGFEGDYAQDKFRQFNQLCALLDKFDNETLMKLANRG